jgi:hypothetical protein
MNEHIQEQIRDHRDKIAQTLFDFIRNLDQTPDAVLHEHMRNRNKKLLDWLQEEERLLAYLNGEPVEPKAHSVEVVLKGIVGGRV